MPKAETNGIAIHYEVQGSGDPVVLLAGLSGAGRGWGKQIDLFGQEFETIVPDHRGTGDSSRPADGYTIEGHAADMAGLLKVLQRPPAHIVGSSTGGAIAQVMALDHPEVVRSISLLSSWTRADDFFRHQFAVRGSVLRELGAAAYSKLSAMFLYSPEFFRDHYPEVRAWCEQSAASIQPEVLEKRIEMILAFDQVARLPQISLPTLVVVGRQDGCTPPYFSQELAALIPGAELRMLDGGHLIYKERPEALHETVREFLLRH